MPWKKDEQGHYVEQDGKPVFKYADDTEKPFDINSTLTHIKDLNKESVGYRIAKDKAEAKLSEYGEITPEKLRDLLAKDNSGKDKKEEVDIEKIKADMQRSFDESRSELEKKLNHKDGKIYDLMRKTAFANSPWLKKNIAKNIPQSMIQNQFASNFEVADNKGEGLVLVGKLNGENIMSKERPGNTANFDEAIEVIINAYAEKDCLLDGGNSGSGAHGGLKGGPAKVLSINERRANALKARGIGI